MKEEQDGIGSGGSGSGSDAGVNIGNVWVLLVVLAARVVMAVPVSSASSVVTS